MIIYFVMFILFHFCKVSYPISLIDAAEMDENNKSCRVGCKA
jgi:hypothetical protein